MLWVDKHRPKALDKVTVHEQVAQNLKKLVSVRDPPVPTPDQSSRVSPAFLVLIHFNGVFGILQVAEQDCPHLLFYGPPGSGKKTLIMALIKQMFGAGAEKVVALLK